MTDNPWDKALGDYDDTAVRLEGFIERMAEGITPIEDEDEVVQLRWDTWHEMCEHAGVGKLSDNRPQGRQDGNCIGLDIPTSKGLIHAVENDWVAKDANGDLYILKPDEIEDEEDGS